MSRLVRPGTNTIAAEVYRWRTGSYLEEQDFWSLFGIQRDVRLYARLAVDIELVNDGLQAENRSVIFEILNGARVVETMTGTLRIESGRTTHRCEALLSIVRPWSAETPALYTRLLTVEGGETIAQPIDFRMGSS